MTPFAGGKPDTPSYHHSSRNLSNPRSSLPLSNRSMDTFNLTNLYNINRYAINDQWKSQAYQCWLYIHGPFFWVLSVFCCIWQSYVYKKRPYCYIRHIHEALKRPHLDTPDDMLTHGALVRSVQTWHPDSAIPYVLHDDMQRYTPLHATDAHHGLDQDDASPLHEHESTTSECSRDTSAASITMKIGDEDQSLTDSQTRRRRSIKDMLRKPVRLVKQTHHSLNASVKRPFLKFGSNQHHRQQREDALRKRLSAASDTSLLENTNGKSLDYTWVMKRASSACPPKRWSASSSSLLAKPTHPLDITLQPQLQPRQPDNHQKRRRSIALFPVRRTSTLSSSASSSYSAQEPKSSSSSLLNVFRRKTAPEMYKI
ncbi:hypothetical protein BCR43DRAFT_493113 [Syncephalastrum racemosum]|uniref:Uncharacterized protein n=1 Tax=Syncephalastrum racemosum TaxID=13706 RepID=A0A1X2HA42_SYNRA|nr:hypothetical protein BCR43DRAFT_493113 [Syncephalastrum racemosum]